MLSYKPNFNSLASDYTKFSYLRLIFILELACTVGSVGWPELQVVQIISGMNNFK